MLTDLNTHFDCFSGDVKCLKSYFYCLGGDVKRFKFVFSVLRRRCWLIWNRISLFRRRRKRVFSVFRDDIDWFKAVFSLSMIWGSHGGEYEDGCLVGCSAVQTDVSLPTLQRSEISVDSYQSTRRYNPVDSHLVLASLNSYFYFFLFDLSLLLANSKAVQRISIRIPNITFILRQPSAVSEMKPLFTLPYFTLQLRKGTENLSQGSRVAKGLLAAPTSLSLEGLPPLGCCIISSRAPVGDLRLPSKPRTWNRFDVQEPVGQGRISAGPVRKIRFGRGPGSQKEKGTYHSVATKEEHMRKRERLKESALIRAPEDPAGGSLDIRQCRWTRWEVVEGNTRGEKGRNNMISERGNKELAGAGRCPQEDLVAVGIGSAATGASCVLWEVGWWGEFHDRLRRRPSSLIMLFECS
jgi:hypothetical protein